MPKQARKPLTDKQTRADIDRSKFRGLKTFKDMTDDEFEAHWAAKDEENAITVPDIPHVDFEARIQKKIQGFEKDYDLIDMKFNDTETLRGLCQALIQMEDLEQYSYIIRNNDRGIDLNNLTLLDKVAQQLSRTRLDMLKMQEELKISRKVRQSDKSISAIAELDDLKAKAKMFYEETMIYVFCPKCKILLGTSWFLFDEADNVMKFECQRVLDTGERCGHTFEVKSKDVYEAGSNTPEVMPEAMR